MQHTIDSFIAELQRISSEKRQLPLKVIAPNMQLLSPCIKMQYEDPLFSDKIIAMIITYD